MRTSEYYYHGTSQNNCFKIISSRHAKISNNIGTLGSGFYAFACNPNNAFKYAKHQKLKRHYRKVSVLKFKIYKKYEQNNILDLTDPEFMEIYEGFVQEHIDWIEHLKRIDHLSNSGNAKKLDGAIIEAFVQHLEENNLVDNVMGVYCITTNKLNKYVVKETIIGNSIELSVRDNNLINYDTMEVM